MSVSIVIALLGGVALFLFGMTLMGNGLKKVAGSSLELVLYRLSNTPVKGLLLGAGVTAVIQSSSATSVMVVGFVNSGMMKLNQAISVVMGAIVGTSITGWILCLSNISGSGWISLLSTSSISAIVAIIGIILRMFTKDQRKHDFGDILLGFSVLMYGMQAMSSAVAPLKESEAFISILTSFSNPFLGILVGAAFTAVLQSASAAVGILQALSMTGAITFMTAYPIILGIAVGASVPVIISALGTKADGKRTAFAYLIVDLFGAIICALLFYGLDAIFDFSGIKSIVMNTVSIAFLNTLFRLITALILAPFINVLAKQISFIIKESEEERSANAEFDRLDEIFLAHPSVAIDQSRLTVNSMAEKARENAQYAITLLANYSTAGFEKVERREDLIDQFEDKLGTYLMKINRHELSKEQNESVSKYLHTLSDFERISDHAMNLAETAQEIYAKKLQFSPEARHEIEVLGTAVCEILDMAIGAFVNEDLPLAYKVEPLEDHIDFLCDEMKLRHVERLQKEECTLGLGFVFNDLLTNFERLGDHCSNIAIALIELNTDEYDTHNYVVNLKELHSHDYDTVYDYYSKKYEI